MAKVTVKHGKDTYTIEMQSDDTFESLQAKVYAVSTVPPKNMRLLNKGMQIKDDNSTKLVKQGTVLTLIGTKQANMMEKIEIKMADVNENIAKRDDEDFGIVNVGNTCYMNAGLQLLRKIPQLKEWFLKSKFSDIGYEGLLKCISLVFEDLEKGTSKPLRFVGGFLHMAPDFGPLGQQQDADQFIQKLIFYLDKVGTIDNIEGKKQNIVSHFFEIEFEDQLINKDLSDEPPKISISTTFKLGVVIGGNQHLKISNMMEGLRAGLSDTLDRVSDLDSKMHTYEKKSLISKLPRYLVVQQVRFYWKQATELDRTQKSTSTKICKSIEFNQNLDLFEFCTEGLKQKLEKGRDYQKKKQEETAEKDKTRFEDFKNAQNALGRACDEREYFKEFQKMQREKEQQQYDEDLYRPHGLGLETGEYTLIGVVTHQGQSANSGHYMAWAHHKGNSWFKYDDEDVLTKKTEDLMTLKGGLATVEIAYVLLYRRRQVV